jgi:hypothetical protein
LGYIDVKIVTHHFNDTVNVIARLPRIPVCRIPVCRIPVCRIPVRKLWCGWLLVALVCNSGCSVAENPPAGKEKKSEAIGVTDVVFLADRSVPESSGLASSLRRKGYFWTHNDSGDRASFYAYDRNGRRTAKVKLKNVTADDWEDCCTFSSDGKPRILIADCGDNKRRRSKIQLFLMEEPDPRESVSLKKVSRITVRYPDGARDCEAVAVDGTRKQIVLLTKSFLPQAGVYVVPLPDQGKEVFDVTVTATKIGSLVLPLVTAADFDEATGDLWVTNYLQAFCFPASKPTQSLTRQIKQLPQAFDLPKWRQIEAMTVDEEQNVWITSEGSPTPLGRLVLKKIDRPAETSTKQSSDKTGN